MTHTPWIYEVHELSEGYSAIVYDEHGQAIADHLTEEHARLIAAAPEMFEALNGMMEIAELAMPDSYQQTDSRMRAARAALAKARGEQ